jgi:hypothetical protein
MNSALLIHRKIATQNFSFKAISVAGTVADLAEWKQTIVFVHQV